MVMPRKVNCRRCHRHTDEVGPLSARKLCSSCATAAMWANAVQIAERSGPYFDRWRRQSILAMLNLDTDPGRSLDLIDDATLAELLSTGTADTLR